MEAAIFNMLQLSSYKIYPDYSAQNLLMTIAFFQMLLSNGM